jgi:hypothetical protein
VIVGIVGSEAGKFTAITERQARHWIRQLCERADKVVSGRSPLGGIDWWAIEEAKRQNKEWEEFPAKTSRWGGPDGFQARNMAIARASDLVACIVVRELPERYTGRRFDGCYHCHTPAGHHVKSGGCWTMHQAERLGKEGRLLVVCS